jgi:3-oxoacyl-[acyl-carrier-protein] synthase II
MKRSIGITGLGVVSPLGLGIAPLWEGLLAGTCALAPITRFDASGFSCRVGGEVPNFSAKDHVPKHYRKAVKVMARDIELAVAAARFAVEDAGLVTRAHAADDGSPAATTYPPDRMGCQIGAGLISAEAEELTSALATSTVPGPGGEVFSLEKWGTTGLANLQPLWMLKYLPNMLACHVTILHGAEGPSNTITCGEASGLLSLGESCRVIERGAADLCFSGGAESKINVMGLLRAELAGKIGPMPAGDVEPAGLVRPYDPRSVGVPSEAGGIVIVEDFDKAKARGARVYARVVGFGAGQAGWPPYSTAEERVGLAASQNRGLWLAVTRALRDANLTPDAIDAIVPQAAGSRVEDEGEAGTLAQIFGARLGSIPLVTVTPNVGNSWAGSGGVAVAVAAKLLSEQTLPARIHAGKPREGLRAGPTGSSRAGLRHVLVCSSSLGGQNAALILQAV